MEIFKHKISMNIRKGMDHSYFRFNYVNSQTLFNFEHSQFNHCNHGNNISLIATSKKTIDPSKNVKIEQTRFVPRPK